MTEHELLYGRAPRNLQEEADAACFYEHMREVQRQILWPTMWGLIGYGSPW